MRTAFAARSLTRLPPRMSGSYAEMLSNRAMALPIANASSFRCTGARDTADCTWFAEAGPVARDTEPAAPPLNAAVPHALWLGPGAVASNAGFPGGIAVRAGEPLVLSLFVYVRAGPATVEAAIVDGMGPGSRLGVAVVIKDAPAASAWVQLKVKVARHALSDCLLGCLLTPGTFLSTQALPAGSPAILTTTTTTILTPTTTTTTTTRHQQRSKH